MTEERPGLTASIEKALDSFIDETVLMPGTKASVVAMVTSQANLILNFMCGVPSAGKPQGILGRSILQDIKKQTGR